MFRVKVRVSTRPALQSLHFMGRTLGRTRLFSYTFCIVIFFGGFFTSAAPTGTASAASCADSPSSLRVRDRI